MSDDIKSFVEGAINENFIVLFTKSFCPYCHKAVKTIKDLKENYTEYQLDNLPNGAEVQDYLLQKTKQRTVPNIFIGQQHVGGNDDLQTAKTSGRLKQLLNSRA
ncbi:9063_t:CDS:2 [Ambispora gerdemannii]|uniref:9063_t:CDS:1 n=1 Tax=Ambispora gerdemannii TaxID=144530 RepID=A0A9N9G701_9GLOM|nr:9063_t:CDS:2 [Ambispora gerdemannii]